MAAINAGCRALKAPPSDGNVNNSLEYSNFFLPSVRRENNNKRRLVDRTVHPTAGGLYRAHQTRFVRARAACGCLLLTAAPAPRQLDRAMPRSARRETYDPHPIRPPSPPGVARRSVRGPRHTRHRNIRKAFEESKNENTRKHKTTQEEETSSGISVAAIVAESHRWRPIKKRGGGKSVQQQDFVGRHESRRRTQTSDQSAPETCYKMPRRGSD